MPELLQNAKDAIEAIFGDTSFSNAEALEALGELADDLCVKIEALENNE